MSDGEISDDVLDDKEDGPWFSMGITRAEKQEASKPWQMSAIVKLVGQSVNYQFLLRQLQSMWHYPTLFPFYRSKQ